METVAEMKLPPRPFPPGPGRAGPARRISLGFDGAIWPTATPAPAPAPRLDSCALTQVPPRRPATPAPAASASPAPSATPGAAEPAPRPRPPDVQTADPFGEPITLEPKKVVIAKGSANWDAAFDTLIESFKTLTALLDKQGIKAAGNPMIVYTSTDDTGFTFWPRFRSSRSRRTWPRT